MKPSELTEIREALEQVRAAIEDLSARVARLEAPPVRAEAPPPEEAAVEAPIDETTLAVIAAAVAAFLGERVHIRQIRLVSSPAWAQQGRVSIQASHRLY